MTENTPIFLHEKPKNTPIFHLYNVFTGSYNVFRMKRHDTAGLLKWLHKKNRKPLILRGARQVGKSTLVRLFCQEQKMDLLEINLERTKLLSLQKNPISMPEVLDEIQLLLKKKITDKALLFFDEIQEQPEMLKYLRFFYEERPDLKVIAAGSLLEIALRDENFSFPVGRVEFYHLGPMTFSEFLLATKNEVIYENLLSLQFSERLHQSCMNLFQKYLYVGGMPEAVKIFSEEESLAGVRDIHQQILQAYLADFPKYHSKINNQRISRVFYSSINYLGKKLVYSKIDSQSQARDIRRVIELLEDARLLHSCLHTAADALPLAGQQDDAIRKLYFLDVGLLNSMTRLDFQSIDLELQNQFSTKGIVAEQFAAQHLCFFDGPSHTPQLHYWLRDKGVQKGEVDFLVESHGEIVPIEVKSANGGHLKSLFYFAKEKKKSKAVKLSVNPYSEEIITHNIDGKKYQIRLLNVPLYAVEFLPKILSTDHLIV